LIAYATPATRWISPRRASKSSATRSSLRPISCRSTSANPMMLAALRPREAVTPADVAEGALHSFLVVAPYLEPGFAAEARAVIEGQRSPGRRRQRMPGAS